MKKFNLSMRKNLMIMAIMAIFFASAFQAIGQDLDPVTPSLQVIPAGSFVIAMDDTLQNDPTYNVFNIRAYGLLATILDNRIELLWAIRAGKAKDDTDFSAIATRAFPTTQAAAIRRFRAGPFIVPAIDTFGLRAVINTFNAANTGHTINVYQLTAATTVDIRYTLLERPRVGVLNDGGNAAIQLNYMALASIPAVNYEELATGANLTNPDTCFTFASEPHNDNPLADVLDSIKSFVTNFGGNFLAECAAIPNYENSTSGRYQTTLGIATQNPNNNDVRVFPHPDLSYTQYEGDFDGNAIGGSCHTWKLITGSTFVNNGSKYDQYGLGADSIIMCQSVSKNGTGVGHLVFYAGGHDYGTANDANHVNGMRSYFNAMFTPSNVQTCAFLIFNNDLAVTKTAKPTSLQVGQQDTFTMVIKNLGPSSVSATGVTAVDTLPAGFSFVSAHSSTGTSYSSTTHVWTVGTMALNQSDTLTIIATAVSGGTITNTIFINKDQYDFNTANDTAHATVTVASCATVNAGKDTTICSGNSVTLGGSPTASGGTGVYTYNWSPSTGLNSNTLANPLATPTVTTTYIVAVTSGTCTKNDTVVVTVHPSPTITANSGSPTYCAGTTIDLHSNPSGGTPGYTYHWSGPLSYNSTAQNPNILNSTTGMSGIYSVTVTDADLCSASAATSNVAVNPNLTVLAGSGNSSYCSGNTLNLNSSASGGTSPFGYTWAGPNSFSNTNQNPSISNVLAADSGLYSVTITDSKGCSGTGSVNVAVHQSPGISASSSSPSYCSGATIMLNSNPSGGLSPYNYSWSGPDVFSSTSQNPTRPNSVVAMSGTYDVTVTDNNGCSASAATGNVIVNQSPSITAGSNNTTYCSGATIQLSSNPLNGTSPFHYSWAGPASYDSTSQNPTVPNSTPSNSGIYSVTVTDANTCTASASTPNITVNPNLSVSLNSSFVLCSGNCAILATSTNGGTSPFGYSWTSGAAPVSNPTVCPLSNTSYTVTVTDSKGCSGTATTNVIVHPKPTANAGSNQSLPSCSLTGTTIGNTPTASGGTAPYTYFWSPPSGLSSDSVADPGVKGIGSNTTYTVVVTDSNGCSASSNVTVNVTGSTLNVTITANGPQNWCASSGGNVTLTAIGQNGFPPYTTFRWTGVDLSSDTTASVVVNPNTAGTYLYTVVITDTTGCQAGTSTTVTVHASPVAHAGAVSDTICSGTSVILGGGPTATGGTPPYSYAWSGGSGAAPVSNPTVTPGSTTNYTVVVTDSNSCSASASSTIVVRTSPNANAGLGQTLPTCSPTGLKIGGSPTASGGGGGPYTYFWSPSVDLSSITISNPQVIGLTVDTTYTVLVADVYGCTASSSVTVDVISNTPKINIAALGSTSWCANSGSSIGLSAVVTHGTNPFDYSWSGADLSSFNSQTTSANPNSAGSYTYNVTVTDAFNCTATDSIKVTVNATPTAVADTGGVSYLICYGTSATIGGNPTASGGTPPYTYSWANGVPAVANPTVFPVASTIYVVTVTDSLGCTAVATTTVFVRSPVVANAGNSQTISACSNSCTLLGGAPTASGGSGGGYTYHWSPSTGLNDSTIANPTACGLSGNTFYSVTVTDSTGCSASAQVLIRVTPGTLQANIEPGGYICAGSGDSVMLGGFPTAVGGTPPYSYSWSPSATLNLHDPANPEASPTVTTVYDLTLTDAQGCQVTDLAVVVVNPKVTVNAGKDTTICAGFPVNLGGQPTATGGDGNYNYQWSPMVGLTSATVANPQALAYQNTTYIITVVDGNGCSASGSVIITVHPTPTANAGANQTLTACPLDSVILGGLPAATGGTPPYTYFWTPSAGLDSTNIPRPSVKGIDSTTTYILFVTDSNSCVSTAFVQVTVTQSTLQADAGNGASLCASALTPVTLGGAPTAVGGTGPFSYHWSPGASLNDSTKANPSASPTASTTYFVTVTDGFGCTQIDSATIVINSAPVANAGTDTAICSGASVIIGGNPTASGGAGPYTYQWSPGTGLNSTGSANPSANPTVTTNYKVTVTDRLGCSAVSAVTITVHNNPVVNAGPDKTMTSCLGDTVYLGGNPDVIGGGTPPYIYYWTPGTYLSDTGSAMPYVTGLATTTSYELIVTDSNGCVGNDFVVVNVLPSTLQASAGNDQTICGAFATPAQLGGSPTAAGGSSPYTYKWYPVNGLSSNTASNPTALPISTTTYYVTVTDAKGCTSVDSVKVTVHPAPTANAGNDTIICNGFAVVLGGNPTALGGTPGYQYAWSPTSGLNSNNIANPVAHVTVTSTFEVTVTDSVGCQAISSVTIFVNPNPAANAGPDKTLSTCVSDSVQLGGSPSATGGTPGYTYMWSPNSTGLITDSSANPWLKGITANTVYTLTVTDVNGCTSTDKVLVTVTQSNLSANAGNGGSYCQGTGTGITLGGSPTAVGGTAPFVYTWSPAAGLNDSTKANPVADPTVTSWYYLTVTDSKGCFATDSVHVIVYPALAVNAGKDSTVCNGVTVQLGGTPTASNGLPPYTYLWSPTGSLSSNTASNPYATPTVTTSYVVTVTSRTNCTATATVTITVNPNPTANAGTGGQLVACSGDSLKLGGTPAGSGGTPPYTYVWSSGAGLSCDSCPNPYVSHLGSGATYTLVVTDSNGCTASSQVAVTVKGSSLTATAGNNATFCAGSVTPYKLGGTPTAAGGNGVYTYTWSPAQGLSSTTVANPNATPTVTTTYYVVVTDGNGCVATDSVRITVNPQPIANAGLNDTVCSGSLVQLGGSPTASFGSGTIYTYQWSPSLFFISSSNIANPTVQPTSNVVYTVVVTDSLGCTGSASVNVSVNPNPVANAGGNQTVVACPLACVTLGGPSTATNGTPPYRYAWSPAGGLNNTGLANPQACDLSTPTTYHVTVTDINGCTASSQATINVTQSTLRANAGVDQKTCQGQLNGVVIGGTPAATGGTGPYTYNWSPVGGILTSDTIANPTVNPADTTTYVLLVQDAVGCVSYDSVNVYVDPAVSASVNNDTSICSGGSVAIGGNPTGGGGTGPYSYTWSPGTGLTNATSGNPMAAPSTTTTYCVTVTDAAHCSASICQTVTVNPAIIACAGPQGGFTMTNCPGSYVQMGCTPTATGGSGNYSYTWAPDSVNGVQVLNGTTLPNPIVTGLSQTTLFSVTVTDNATGCTATAQVNVNVNQSTLTAHAGNPQTFCGGSTTCITIGGTPASGSGGFPPLQYAWSPTVGINNPAISNPCVIPTVTTTYVVTVTDRLGCNAVDSVTIAVNPQISVNAGTDTSICSHQSVVLGGNPEVFGGTAPYTYAWSPSTNLSGTNLANPVAQNLTLSSTYTVVVTDSFHCTASGSIAINVRPLPITSAGPPATIYPCSGDSAILGGSPTASGTLGPYTYSWTPPFNLALSCLNCSNPVVSELGHTTLFKVVVTDTFGCQNSDSVLVTVLPNTVFANATPASLPTLCSNVVGSCVTLGGSPAASGGVPGYNYSWTGGVVSDSVIAHPQACPTATTTYTLIVTDSKGCQAADSVTVIVNKPPVVSISGLNTQYCINAGNVTMTGTPAGGIFSGPGITGNVFQPSVVGAGNWCIKYAYTDQTTGCTGDTIICVTVSPLPVLSIGGNVSSSYCQSDAPFVLIGTPAGGIFSGPGMRDSLFQPDSANVGSNTITYTYTNPQTGCSNTAQLVLTIKANPTLSVSASSDTACTGQPITLTPTYSFDVFNIVWSKLGGGTITTGLNPIVVNPTGVNYCVIATAVNTPNGCVTRDTICIDVYQPPVINTPVVANTCENQPVAVNIAANVTDPQGHADVYTILVAPLHGTLTNTGTGTYTYTPAPYFHGQDSFKFAVCNSLCSSTCDTGTGYINVCYVPYPPVIVDTTITIYENDSAHVCPQIYDYNNLPLVIGNAACDSLIGQLIFTSDSCFEYIPTPGFVGTQTLCITVCDTAGLCDTGMVIIHVVPINKPPLAYPEQVYTCVNTPIGVNVAAATVDPDGNPLTYSYGSVTGPAGSTHSWVKTGNGAQVFVANKPGVYTIPYYVCNHSPIPVYSLCDSSTITVTVIACDSVPTTDSIAANNDGVVTHVGVPVNINELANDYYPNPDSLTVTIVTGSDLGGATATVDSNGEITYNSPTPGIDTIEYQICDPAPLCATALIVIYVDTTPGTIIYPPVAVDDFDSTNYQSSVVIPVLNNDHCPSGDSIHVTAIISGPGNGTTVINPNGTVTYTPDSNVTTVHPDTFVYQICEVQNPTECDTATVVVYIRPDAGPSAYPEHVYTCVATPIGVNVAAATSDPYGNTLTYVYGGITGPGQGTWVTTSPGAQVFVANLPGNYTIPYTVCAHDPASGGIKCASNVITVTVINCGNTSSDSIAANNDGVVTNVGDTVVINELANDYYPYPDSLTVTIVSGPVLGGSTAVINPNGTVTYSSPTPGQDTIEYQICDPAPLCATAYIIITVDTTPTNINVPPVAVNDYDSTAYQTSVTVPVLNNDHSPSGDSIHVTGVISGPSNGTTVVNPNGTITYTPDSNVTTMHPDTFVYQICENQNPTLCDTATVVVYIRPDSPPLAWPEHVYTCVATPIGVNVAAATSDPYGNTLTFTYGTITGPGTHSWVTTSPGAQVFVGSAPGNYTIPYTVCAHDPASGGILCASSVITVTVINCGTTSSDSIAANNDGVVTNVGDTVVINELANDYYPNDTALTVTILTGPDLGGATAVINANGTVTYTSPTPGRDTIEYQICDPAPLCATAYIIITVDTTPTNINVPPVAVNDYDSTYYETTVIVPVLNNDHSPSGDSIHVTGVISGPGNGTTVVNPNGTISYTPDSAVTPLHPDTFVYQICETQNPNLCDTATVVVYIIPVNTPPTALPQTVYACLKTPIGVDVAGSTGDPNGYPLTYSYGAVSGPGASAWVTTGNGAQVFVGSVSGTYTVTYTVCNHNPLTNTSLCASNVITIIVINCDSVPTNDSIAANNDLVTTEVNTITNINELGNDFYPYADSLTVTIISGPGLPGATASVDSNGSITYNSPVVGHDTIEYQICDPAPLCATAYIYITVDSVPHTIIYPPVAVNDFDSTNYLTPVIIPVLNNDYNLGGDSFHIPNNGILCQPSEGTVTLNPNGTITYHPDSAATACHPDTFCYRICDVAYPTLCDTAQVVVYIRPIIYAVNDTASTSQYTPAIIPVLHNDHSPDCDSFGVYKVIPTGTVGTVIVNPNGTVTYIPKPDTCGFTDSFRYVDTSAYGAHDTATVYVTIICCPTRLIAVADTETMQPNDTLRFNPAANDIDSGATLSYEVLVAPANGHAYYANDTTLVYVPNAGFCGKDSLLYEGKGPCGVDTGKVIINIVCRRAPIVHPDTVSTCKTLPVNVNVFLKDTAETGFTLSITNVGNAIPGNLGGVSAVNGGVITFTPSGATGTVSFTYTVCDNGQPQLCSISSVVINITNCQQPQVDTIYDTTFINTPGTACIGKYVNSGGNPWKVDSLCNPQNGTDSIVGPGDTCIVYIPNPNFYGNDTFCIVVCDTFGCTTSEVIYTVIDTNIRAFPIYCDADTSYKDQPDTLHLLAIDSIPKAADTTVVITTAPLKGHVTVNTNLTVTYLPDTNYLGTDEFIYEVCAITGSYKYCDTASVCITIVDTAHHCFIPDGFSPNGDGVNDVYVIPCNDNYPAATLKVYSRWGDEVWDSNGPYQNNWDGKNQNGIICPTGTYFIIYDYNDGIHKSVAKFVVLNR